MKHTIYKIVYETMVVSSGKGIVSASSKARAENLLEKEVKDPNFKAWETIDTGFKADKEGIIYSGYN